MNHTGPWRCATYATPSEGAPQIDWHPSLNINCVALLIRHCIAVIALLYVLYGGIVSALTVWQFLLCIVWHCYLGFVQYIIFALYGGSKRIETIVWQWYLGTILYDT